MLSYNKLADYRNTSTSYSLISYFVSSKKIENFLKNTQAGAAHATYGTDFSVLVKHLMASLVLCLVQLLMFCYLRGKLKRFYQPRTFIDYGGGLIPCNEGMFNWIIPTWCRKSDQYLDLGLDSFFFLRFIRFLLMFFSLSGLLNMAVLIPVNLLIYHDTPAKGLDRLSISNISRPKVHFMNFYFVCGVLTVGLFEFMIRNEFRYIAKARQKYLNSWKHRGKISSRMLLLGNIPKISRSESALKKLFDQFPGGAEQIWLLDNYHKYFRHHLYANEAIQELELFLLKLTKMKNSAFKEKFGHGTSLDFLLSKTFYPPLFLALRIGSISKQTFYVRIPGIFRLFFFQKRISLISWTMKTLEDSSLSLHDRVNELSLDKYQKMNKAFILFQIQESAYMAHQTLLSPEFGNMDVSIVEVDKDDIIWQNLIRRSCTINIIIKHIINGVIIVLTCLYVVPVSLITLISQIPVLTQLLPFMGFLTKLPDEVGSIFSSLFPALILTFLTEIQQIIFRRLLLWKGHWTGAEIELDIQVWYFIFVFIQQFLVVSVLTSVVVVFLNLVEKPVSIPLILADNIPMSSIFFFKYLSVKAFALCGSNFLRIRSLVRWLLLSRLIDRTPRQKVNRTKQLTKMKWGASYASFSVCGAIGIIYSTIAPLVALFMIILLLFFQLYYKHALKYMYSKKNESDTNGRLYPRALFQLYTGIYCFEFCLVGIFLSLRNEKGDHTMKVQALIMAFVFGLSVSSNIMSYKSFEKLFTFAPQINNDQRFKEEEEGCGEVLTMNSKEMSLLYLHPCYQYQKPTVWLPKDANGQSEQLLELIGVYTEAIAGSTTQGAELKNRKFFSTTKVTQPSPKQ